MNELPYHIIEVTNDNLEAIKQVLSDKYPFTQIGQRLRVMVDKSAQNPIAEIKSHSHKSELNLKLTQPNLEDVFVCNTGTGRQ